MRVLTIIVTECGKRKKSEIEGNFNLLSSSNKMNGGRIYWAKKHWEMGWIW